MMNQNYKSFSINIKNIVNSIDLNNIENDIDEEDIVHNYNPFLIKDLQWYNPIFSLFFPIIDKSKSKDFTFNHFYQFVNMNQICDINGGFHEKPVFIKFAPLLDPIRYMIGKYESYNDKLRILPKENTFCLESSEENDSPECKSIIFPKLQTIHNASYVDCFFCFLSSQLLHTYDFLHSIDFYGSYLGIQEKYKMNITDDFDYVKSSIFFNENIDKLFTIVIDNISYKNENENDEQHNNSQKNKKRIFIEEQTPEINEIVIFDNLTTDPPLTTTITNESKDFLIEKIYEKQSYSSNSSLSSGSGSSSSSFSSDEQTKETGEGKKKGEGETGEIEEGEIEEEEIGEEEIGEEEDWETDEEEEEEEEEDKVIAYMNDFPVQMICLEKCSDTLDSLFMNNEMDDLTATSALFQIVITLALYQKIFHFTHNDLHTNNIMYIDTDIDFLYYQFENKNYKVPTYGKIFKIIDFGRSIYKIQNKILCSDSFGPQGDAHSQYNFEPFFNESKPRLDPNYSFDLCRLACSIYDFIIEDDDNEKLDEFQKTIKKWCTDDNGKNVLYKSNGDERYPNFKLYKMISRTVHNCIPSEELNIPLFKQFKFTKKIPKKVNLMNLDAICEYH
jgi:hypothetical protein